jgi:hypothetical protein
LFSRYSLILIHRYESDPIIAVIKITKILQNKIYFWEAYSPDILSSQVSMSYSNSKLDFCLLNINKSCSASSCCPTSFRG